MVIYEGTSRYEKQFKRLDISWEELTERLKTTVRTPETASEYKSYSKDRQDSIKDVGAFVAGELEKGRRKQVKNRTLITLDADYAPVDFSEILKSNLKGLSYCIYSTHKHCEESPRYRLLLPLKRAVTKEEYGAIARKIAQTVGIDIFDDTTYQAQRIMYWPSTSKDGVYSYATVNGEFVDPDSVLSSYEDWTDVRSWPVSSRQIELLRRGKEEAEDPLEKEGTVGAFCRAYSIEEAIEKFVSDYKPGSSEGRYTYDKGSTSNGVVVYEGKFSYSHHDTDPASLRLCNAFDLVRLHKFSHLDRKAGYTSHTQAPSYKAMLDLASRDNKVKLELTKQFSCELESPQSADDGRGEAWVKQLKITRQGQVVSNYHNIELILSNHEAFKDKLAFDEFSECYKYDGKPIVDHVDAWIRSYLDKKFGITGRDKIYDCIVNVCMQKKEHPVKDYLESLTWDGKERCKDAFIDYFACDEPQYLEYTKAVSRKFFYSAVKRIYEPGCRIDEMLTLRGEQGCGKSTFFYRLSKGFFTDSIKNIKSKDAMDLLRGVWICEFGELAALRKSDSEDIKGFLSSAVDRYREAYGRRTQDHKRSCIFVATTNELEFLRDPTGNRRYWVLNQAKGKKPNKSVFEMTDEYVDQLWAEAKYLYDNGLESEVLTGKVKKTAKEIQENFRSEDPREDAIKEYLETLIPDGWYDMPIEARIDSYQQRDFKGVQKRRKVCAREIWQECFGNYNTKQFGRYEASEINRIIDSLPNWERATTVRVKGYGTAKGFKRKPM